MEDFKKELERNKDLKIFDGNVQKLPIFADTLEILQRLLQAVSMLSKGLQESIGARTINHCLDCINYIYKAQIYPNKREKYLELYIANWEQVKIFFGLIILQVKLGEDNVQRIITLFNIIDKQVHGWYNSCGK